MNMKATIVRGEASPQCVPCSRGRLRFIAELRRWARRMDRLVQLRRERNQLLELNDHQLRDIGLTRHEAARESRRHFWDDIGWRR
ncbi:DUF1127 domain-containing protein [Halomonas alkalisoli]|uniref:DUF1127 domain-containing protein n=1 Tax=Halomonas alkalisoli TaxID=2907158 RepID=UPI001F419B3E|nr:DUF1127 domain-containing protein [Halomonas alkalisoli]MCE9680906.1 DUF1127 domain-containing protein [Halomonas alkalisoli]